MFRLFQSFSDLGCASAPWTEPAMRSVLSDQQGWGSVPAPGASWVSPPTDPNRARWFEGRLNRSLLCT